MKKVIFSKFSRERKSEYRIATKLVVEDGVKKIVKENLEKEGLEHIKSLETNMTRLQSYYQDEKLVVTPCKLVDNAVEFEYIDGCRYDEYLADIYERQGYSELKNEILKLFNSMKKVANIEQFRSSSEFEKVFGVNDYSLLEGKTAYTIANIDMIFGNLILSNNKLYITDYEWVFDILIPVDYVIYRSLLFSGLFSTLDENEKKDILSELDIKDEEIVLYMNMETGFQNYVSGKKVLEEYANNSSNVIYNIEEAQKAIVKKILRCYQTFDGQKKLISTKAIIGDYLKVEEMCHNGVESVEMHLDCQSAIIKIFNVCAKDSNGDIIHVDFTTNSDFNVVEDYYFSGDSQIVTIKNKNFVEIKLEMIIYHSNSNLVKEYIDKIKNENSLNVKLSETERKLVLANGEIKNRDIIIQGKDNELLLRDGDIKFRDELIKGQEDIIKSLNEELTAIRRTKVWRVYSKCKNILGKKSK